MLKHKYIASFFLLFLLFYQSSASITYGDVSPNLTTKYRVYQNDRIIMEYSSYPKALERAKKLRNSRIEEIATKKWLWDNFPRYQLSQYNITKPGWQFATLQDALNQAKKWDHASIRDLRSKGWVWNNYPKYKVYQGQFSKQSWEFVSFSDAVKEAKRWGNSNIIDLRNNKWIWDNIPAAKKQEYRKRSPIYAVYFNNTTRDGWRFSYLEDALKESVRWQNTIVVNTVQNNAVVYSNLKKYEVYQNANLLKSFVSLDEAIAYANRWAHAKIVLNKREIWNNYPYYQVYQNSTQIGEYSTIKNALFKAVKYENASIVTYGGEKLWSNYRRLHFWTWNGSAASESVKTRVSGTMGLDTNSPSWFELKDENGNMTDSSDAELAEWLKQQNIAVHPLVGNQFKSKMTSNFLKNPAAQQKFITQLITRAVQLGVHGLNIDFESLSGKDRDAYTAFIKSLTDAAHSKKIIVSIDLPRGDISWNHLTAYDHVKLAGIVDYIITMTYDEHYSASPTAGSVAGLPWVEEGVLQFLSYGIPRDKLLLGVPFYQREWTMDASGKLISNRAIMLKDSAAIIAEKNATKIWDAEYQQYRIEYMEDGYKHVFWLEDQDSIKARLNIAKKYDLAGVAAWRLGYENSALWSAMIKQK